MAVRLATKRAAFVPEGVMDRRGFEERALPHLRALYGLALRLTGDASAAEDLVQETYLKGLQAFVTLRDPDRVRPWLFQILSRLVTDRRRASGREVPLETPDAMSCADAQRRFFAYLDRALAGEDVEALEAHLEA